MDTDPRDWEELATDGDIYYHNVRSHKTVWSKPDCLLTEAERVRSRFPASTPSPVFVTPARWAVNHLYCL